MNGSSDPIGDPTPALVSNDSSGMIKEDLFIEGGEDVLHCGGVLDGSDCTDPETDGSAHTYPALRSAFDGSTPLPSEVSLQAFELSNANSSVQTSLSPGLNQLTVNESATPVQFAVQDYSHNPVGVSEIRVENRTTGETVQRWVDGTSPNLPLFLSSKTQYDVVIERDSGETHRRPVIFPTKGITEQQIRVSGASPAPSSEVVGQIRNESDHPVDNVTITAEPAGWGGEPPAYNSTTTDENGLFAMELPESGEVGHRYQFKLESDRTDNGTLVYFPTRADRQGDGYEVREERTILPPLTIKRGGEVDINVTNTSGGSIGSSEAITSLSRTTTATGDRTRDSIVESFSLFSFPDMNVNETVVRVPSPTTSVEEDVSYNVWGANADGLNDICARQTDVSQGERTPSDCVLERGGTLNITLEQYRSIIEKSDSRPLVAGDPSFYNENVLIVRNATTGNVTTYLGPGGIQQYFVPNDDPNVLSLPVPEGDYTVELRPRYQWIDRTSVRNTTSVSVTVDQSSRVALDSGRDFLIEPDMERTDTTLRRTADNSIAVYVGDPATGELLNGTDIDASLRLTYRNGTVASSTVPLEYNDTSETFENTTYSPDVDAGQYVVELKATHENGDSTYNTTIRERVAVSDFATQIQTKRQTVERGESFRARLRAFNLTADSPKPIDATADNITLTVYDRDGNALDGGQAETDLTGGRSTIELPGFPSTGVYRIGVLVEADDGRQGIDDTWIRISDYDIDVSLDKSVYTPEETVEATVSLTDATGSPVDASLETTTGFGFDNGTVSVTNGTTNGEATVELDPESLFENTDAWDGSTYAEVEATIETDAGLERVRAGTGIRIRPFQIDASPAREQYSAGEDPVIGVAVPPNTQSVNVTHINGQEVDPEVEGTNETDGFYRITLDSDQRYDVSSEGDYRVRIEATNANGRTATDRARFTVSSLKLRAEPTARSYEPSDDVTVNAELRYRNGSRASGESVEMELYEEGSPPVRVDTNASAPATDADGRTVGKLQPASEGVHVVVVSAGGSERVFPVLVNDITTEFVDETGAPVDSYEFTPGQDDATINISASNGTDIDGQMLVRALIDGEPIELGTSDVVGGDGGIEFSVPESANTGTYPVEVFVRSETGAFDSATTRIELTADDATISVETDARETVYEPGDDARIRATVTEGGDPVEGDSVEFTLLSKDAERSLGSGTTGPDGTVTINEPIPSDLNDGEYGIRATHESGTSAFDGILLSSVDLSIATNESAYAAGDTVAVNLSATDDGTPVSDAEGGVRVRLSDGSTVTQSFDRTGESPYEVEIELPDDEAAIGTRTVEAFVRNGSSVAVGSTSIEVFNADESADLSVPETIVANETAFTVTANATVETDANLTVFSPGTASVAHAESLSLNASTSLSLSEPGTYVFRLSVPGVGTETVVRNVDADPGDPEVRVGPDLTTNATAFEASEDVYIRTEASDMTAEVFSPDGSVTVPLNREDGGTHYGVLPAADTDPGPYLVRLDGTNATDVDSVLIEVSD